METRLASPPDADSLAALHGESFDTARWNSGQFAQSLKLPTTKGWIAQDQCEMLGLILCQITDDESEILTFCVSPRVRRRGVGSALLATAMHTARSLNSKRFFLDVLENNTAALALYKKAGFEPTGRRLNYYTHHGDTRDALILSLTL